MHTVGLLLETDDALPEPVYDRTVVRQPRLQWKKRNVMQTLGCIPVACSSRVVMRCLRAIPSLPFTL